MTRESQALRDLEWVINSPSLISKPADQIVPHLPLDKRAIDVDDLEGFLETRKDHRVGRYFENLILYWLVKIREVELLANAYQVQVERQTIGELDFVFRDEQQIVTHWEVAVKFFLYLPEINSTGSHLIGPNSADNFEKKITKLFRKQLPLSKTAFPEVARREAFVKGRIFYHPDDHSPSPNSPELSSSHLRATWVRESDLSRFERSMHHRFQILKKPYWLSPVRCSDTPELLTGAKLIETIADAWKSNRHPVLVGELRDEGREWTEVDRVFVVPEEWPKLQTRDSV
jgi:hypothetical protein